MYTFNVWQKNFILLDEKCLCIMYICSYIHATNMEYDTIHSWKPLKFLQIFNAIKANREEKKGKGKLALTSVIKGEHLTQLWLGIPCLIKNWHRCPSLISGLLYQKRGLGNWRIYTIKGPRLPALSNWKKTGIISR